MVIIGVSAFYHDSAAAILIDGNIVAAAQEERFTRKKHDSSYPVNAINYCLEESNLTFDKVDYFAFYDKPFLKFERLLETYVALAPKGFQSFRLAMPVWLSEKLFLKKVLLKEIKKVYKNFDPSKLMFGEHHFSHASSAFYASPFEEAVVLTLDGVGEWATSSVAIGRGHELKIVKEIHFPHSLGLLYSAFTYYIGFRVNSGEYKVMGLAPYGEGKYKELILNSIVDLKKDGSFRLNQSYFNYAGGLTMVNKKFIKLFGQPIRQPDKDEITQFHMDIAASIQEVLEEIVLTIVQSLSTEYNISNLCLAGGVALNCVVNGKILNSNLYKNLWIQPASGDAGGALGVALALWHSELKNPRKAVSVDSMKGSFLGPSYEQSQIENQLLECGANFDVHTEEQIIEKTSEFLSNGLAVGWFQGRMEFGPRSLGNRSILGNPLSDNMQSTLNLKVKYRESFRPFAPSVLSEDVNEWFDIENDSPYMLLVGQVNKDKILKITKEEELFFGISKLNIKRSIIPAVTHVDHSARVQTVHIETNPKYYKLIKSFKERTDCPVLINTSFNVRGEPIVGSPKDAFDCFMGTELDYLVIGNCILKKETQNKSLTKDYKNKYHLD